MSNVWKYDKNVNYDRIEDHVYYVTMTDMFLSGWGKAQNKINKLVLKCDSYDDALIVEQYAKTRSEMKHINICMNKPYYNKDRYYVSLHDKTSYSNWYKIRENQRN
jgi:hypothetical protein